MDRKSEQKELLSIFRQQQEKYVYYLAALCVTSIGFSVYKTSGEPIKEIQIPLAIAVLSWGISIYCGLTFIAYSTSTVYANKVFIDTLEGNNPEVGRHPEMIKAAADGIWEVMQSNSNEGKRYFSWQRKLFYLGNYCLSCLAYN